MRKVYRLEYQDKHWWLTIKPAWFPDNWENMEYCARILLNVNGTRAFFKLWGRSKASIISAWEEGRYDDFCGSDDGSSIKGLDLLQAIDYVVLRLGSIENYAPNQISLQYFENGELQIRTGKLYWLDCDQIAPYTLKIQDSSGKAPNPLPPFGKSGAIERFYNLDKWETSVESVPIGITTLGKDPKSGRSIMVPCINEETITYQLRALRIK